VKVALATDWYLPRLGGIELHLADLAKALTARGAEIGVVTTTPGTDDGGDIAVRRLRPWLLPNFDLAISPRLVAMLKAELVAGRYDLLHAHISVISPVGYGAVLAAHALGMPTVVTFCGVLLRSAGFLRATDGLLGWSRWPIAVTAVSGLIADQLRAALPGLDVIVLPNGVDGDFWRRPPLAGRGSGEIVAVTAMRLNRKKRPLPLLRAFFRAHAGAARQGRHLTLRIVGDGPLRAQLERYVADQGVGGDVEFLGAVPRETLAEIYRRADIFVMPSIHESFGIAALEARCAGLPVVGMREAGIAEFLRHGETALLAAGDAELARDLERLALDDGLRARLARTDPRLARFEWPNVADAHIACYEQAMALD
jgi:glycosyltransferase involved in cell wall biosynthesis